MPRRLVQTRGAVAEGRAAEQGAAGTSGCDDGGGGIVAASKIQQNISGRLTSEQRTKDRYKILGYVSSAAKNGD
jgi:hypothetical protein